LINYSDTDGFPSFSPDGRWIVFTRQLCTIPDHEPPNGADLFAVAVDGSELLQLTNQRALTARSARSPRGRTGTTWLARFQGGDRSSATETAAGQPSPGLRFGGR
jgi:Tol biopolymer transport system component